MATVYHRDQTGAPVLTYSSVTSNIAHFVALKNVLKACLVNGYDSQVPAGWTLVNEGSDFIVLRNGTQSGYVCLSWAGSAVTAWLAETYTGMNGNVMTGAGLKTGTAASNSVPHRLEIGYFAHSSGSTSWVVIADNRSFIFNGGGYTSELSLGSTTIATAMMPFYVGEDSFGNFIAVGGQNAASGTPTGGFYNGGFTTLRNPVSGLLVDTGSLSVITPGLSLDGGVTTETSVFVLSEAPVCPAWWGSGSTLAGKLRGVAQTPALSLAFPSPAARCLGFVGNLTTRNFNTALPLDGPYAYFMACKARQSAAFMITNNPEFW